MVKRLCSKLATLPTSLNQTVNVLLAKLSANLFIATKGKTMYAKHYYHYKPSISTNIMDRFRKMGWVPPSEDPEYLEKWNYYKNCEWNKKDAEQHA